ncbi:MAG: DUF3943 domain-containing protein [Muribaculaceae bacterium]|nr:DUF3943 domain-containing protein [Muribaculaceae bacterium]
MQYLSRIIILVMALVAVTVTARADSHVDDSDIMLVDIDVDVTPPDSIVSLECAEVLGPTLSKGSPISIYELPYSRTLNSYNWKGLWINTGVLTGAFVGTLLVLECLPEDATSWNRAALQKDSPGKRWFNNIFKKGPEWDHDNAIFNYVLHPYAGAAYFMAARSNGFNFYRSLLYSACISTIGWEFGIEACMERPSYQDIFITPLVGSIIGEAFYKAKRSIVSNNYRLLGSKALGYIVAFLVDPVNEFVGYCGYNPARHLNLDQKRHTPPVTGSLIPSIGNGSFGFTLYATF